jgi:hypothetical protein
MMELLNFLWGLVSSFFFLILGRILSKQDMKGLETALQGTKELDLDETITQRIEGLDDYWEGTVHQQDGPGGEPIEFPIKVRFYVNSLQKVRGKFSYNWNDKKTVLEAKGKAVDNRIIVLEFKDANKNVIRFGTFMFDFDQLGEYLDGHFVAYAAERKAIVTGSVTLYRKLG